MNKCDAIAAVCRALADESTDAAVATLREFYPFSSAKTTNRRHGPMESTRVFVRDGFVDRYSGQRLIFPPVFRLLSAVLPSEFPYHPHWKTGVTHPAYWEIGATLDHFVPVTRGGADDESNWMTTSMAQNQAKKNWTLQELGWRLHPPGKLNSWDGMAYWFLEYAGRHPETLSNSSLKQWHRAAKLALNN